MQSIIQHSKLNIPSADELIWAVEIGCCNMTLCQQGETTFKFQNGPIVENTIVLMKGEQNSNFFFF